MPKHMEQAALTALSKVGHATPHGEAGWCLEWCVVDVYDVPAPWKFRTVYRTQGHPWAAHYWNAAKQLGRVVETSDPTRIPRGAMTFSKGAAKYGHVFIATGDGWCCSTDYPTARRIGRIRITDLLRGWNHRLLGYIEITGEGFDFRNPGPPDQMDPANYYLGAVGDHVVWLGQRLLAHGYPGKYRVTETFTGADVKAVSWFQRQQNWTGNGADGLPGIETLRRLAA